MKLLLRLALTVLAVLALAIAPATLAHADAGDGGSDVAGNGSGGGTGSGDGGGSGGGGLDGGGTEGPAGISVPRVMVEEFDTSPGSVQAGQTFEVSFVLRNTSTKTRVSNMKVTAAKGGSRVAWSATFKRKDEKPAEGADNVGAKKAVAGIYTSGLGALKQQLEAK